MNKGRLGKIVEELKRDLWKEIVEWKQECVEQIGRCETKTQNENKDILERIKIMKDDMCDEIKKLRDQGNEITHMDTGGDIDIRLEIAKAVKDEENKKRRKENLVIYNLDESEKRVGAEREEEDRAKIRDLLDNGVKEKQYKILKVIRLGKKGTENSNNYKRPVLIKLENEQQKWDILKSTKNLKNASGWMKNTGISQDLTKEERQQNRVLREELKEKRKQGEQGWFIRNGKIQNRDF